MIAATSRQDAAAYHALVRGILTIERRIAPLWAAGPADLTRPERVLRERVTANCFRELDVLLGHWTSNHGACRWFERRPAAAFLNACLPADIVALAALYWAAAHAVDALHDCNLLTRSPHDRG